MTMADRIVVMNHGRIEQLGTPSDLYEQPAHRVRRGLPRRLEPAPRRGRRRRQACGSRTARRCPCRRQPSPDDRLGADRGPPREAPDRVATSRTGSHGGTVSESGVHRRRHPVHRRHAGGSRHRLRPERPAGSPRRGARRPAHAQLESGLHLRRRCPGGHVMSDRLTRQDFLRRTAVGGSMLASRGSWPPAAPLRRSALRRFRRPGHAAEDDRLLELAALHRRRTTRRRRIPRSSSSRRTIT